jgi:hypothetical protein
VTSVAFGCYRDGVVGVIKHSRRVGESEKSREKLHTLLRKRIAFSVKVPRLHPLVLMKAA